LCPPTPGSPGGAAGSRWEARRRREEGEGRGNANSKTRSTRSREHQERGRVKLTWRSIEDIQLACIEEHRDMEDSS
jgi:hypothetical protein